MIVELNCNKYAVKRYKGEALDAYYYKGVLYDDKPKWHDVYGVFTTEDCGTIGVVDKMPTPINLILSLVMLSITAILIAVDITTVEQGNTFVAHVEPVKQEVIAIVDTSDDYVDGDYEYTFKFNKYVYLNQGELCIDFTCNVDCNLVLTDDNGILIEQMVLGDDTCKCLDVGDVSGILKLIVECPSRNYVNVLEAVNDITLVRTVEATATPSETVYREVKPEKVGVTSYGCYRDGKYVDAEILNIDGVRCVHILSNCDISKSYWSDDYHYPLVIGYSDADSYNMILGVANKKNTPENVIIINDVFSLSTVEFCNKDYFTYSYNQDIVEMYIPLDALPSNELPLDDDAIIVDSVTPITVQINSNIIQYGNDNIHAIVLK